MKPMLLDCTLRDGAYIVDSQFGEPVIHGLIQKLEEAGAEIIECGWLKNQPHAPGSSFYHVPADLERYLGEKKKHVTYTVMIDWDRYDLSCLPACDGRSLDAVRVVFPHGRHREGVGVGEEIARKGYKVFFQAANTLAYSDEELRALAAEINRAKPVSLSIVDTFGAMYEEDLERIVNVLDAALLPEIALGFHSHNNQQLSFALSIHFLRLFRDRPRQVIVDASLCGMGRGAGNATTELVVSYLNRKCGCHYDMDAVMDAIDVYMELFQERYQWGYSTPYFIAGLYCCHVNNIAYLLNNHRTNARDMRNVIEAMDPANRLKYDYDLLEQTYLNTVGRRVEDAAAAAALREALLGREVLLIAPGRRAVTERERIRAYIRERDPVILGVNALVSDYAYDYLFFVNPARYEYAASTYPERFAAAKHILLSNIKTEPEEGELILAYEHAVKKGWRYFDNAMICALRLMDWLGLDRVTIAGFDGFKTRYNESYGDPYLPTLNPDGNWDALNREILEMVWDFRRNARTCKELRFLTESCFERGEEEGK